MEAGHCFGRLHFGEEEALYRGDKGVGWGLKLDK